MARITVLILLIFITNVSCGSSLVIDLQNKEPTNTNSEMISMILEYNDWAPNSIFRLTGISKNIGFFIIQAHNQYNNIIMSYNKSLSYGNHVNGTNVGLILYPWDKSEFYLTTDDENSVFDILLSVHGYFKNAPVPGGCNMEFNVKDAPFLQLNHNSHIINVDASPPGLYNNKTCSLMSGNMSLSFYQMYFAENDHSASTYFSTLNKMMTVENIYSYGKKVSNMDGYGQMRRVFALYPDVGSIYAVVVTYNGNSAAYVPVHTYGCSLISSCQYPSYAITVIALSVTAGIGLLLCVFGHYLFKIHVFIVGFISTAAIGLIVVGSQSNSLTADNMFTLCMICGVVGGICWIIHWCCCSCSITIVLLDAFCFGCLLAGIFNYAISDKIPAVVNSSFNFWWTCLIIILICQIIMTLSWQYCIIITCSFLGSFAIVLLIDFFVGSYLRYICFDLIRRATVNNFNQAIIIPPFQWRDIITTFSWIALFILSVIVQSLINKKSASRSASVGRTSQTACCCMKQEENEPDRSALLSRNYPNYAATQIYSNPLGIPHQSQSTVDPFMAHASAPPMSFYKPTQVA